MTNKKRQQLIDVLVDSMEFDSTEGWTIILNTKDRFLYRGTSLDRVFEIIDQKTKKIQSGKLYKAVLAHVEENKGKKSLSAILDSFFMCGVCHEIAKGLRINPLVADDVNCECLTCQKTTKHLFLNFQTIGKYPNFVMDEEDVKWADEYLQKKLTGARLELIED